ncbi:hypothetical protein GO986_12360 [Deinococcus sp. HMF7620]|uniref:Type II secretion system protein GspE N-terminal domain-containing protein n=1 Tax=Deinococcus arboris TaxID=2682977 RepID=A0A7C9M9C3_9DEIO|nr:MULTISPECIES: hypothetical protein [Deinococcus]MBZ9752186.1 hypothetical protein [Deinococcus betulae]MVN87559.1 hypothetical protein [Deinococcus arboris]
MSGQVDRALTVERQQAANAYQAVHGGDFLGALEATLSADEVQAVWSELAAERGWTFYSDHRSLSSIEGHLLSRKQALHLGITPHRQEYTDCCVLTPDPDVPLDPIYAALGPQVKLCLVPPSVYDRVSQLTYPTALWGRLTETEALALATSRHIGLYLGMTIQGCLESKVITHDQAARAQATVLRLPYADVRRSPPDPTLRALLPPETQRHLRVYPYQLIDGTLTVLMEQPDPGALRLLAMTMQREVRPVITAATTIRDLLKEDADEAAPTHAKETELART